MLPRATYASLTNEREQRSGLDSTGGYQIIGAAPTVRPDLAAMRAVAREVQRGSIPPPPIVIENVDSSPLYANDFEDTGHVILGEIAASMSPLTAFPIAARLHRKFTGAHPSPKRVRHETLGAFSDYRASRRADRLDDLDRRLAIVEAAIEAHTGDNHGGGRVGRLEDELHAHIAEHVIGLAEVSNAADAFERPIRLPLPAWDRSTACWMDGDDIVCAVKSLAPDGTVRVTTSGTSFARALDTVVGCMARVGADPVRVAPALPHLAQIVGGMSLIGSLADVALALSKYDAGKGISARMRYEGDPELRAAMALYQHCQMGDQEACAEWARLRERPDGAVLCDRAKDAILSAQSQKARGRL